MDAEIFVLVSLRQYEKQFFPYRDRRFTPGAIKRGCFKLVKTWFPHETIINDANQRDKTSESFLPAGRQVRLCRECFPLNRFLKISLKQALRRCIE